VPIDKARRMAFTARIIGGFEEKVIESLKIAYPILVSSWTLPNIQNFSVYHKNGYLYSYFEYADENVESDIEKLQESLKVENELDWLPMKEVFHTD